MYIKSQNFLFAVLLYLSVSLMLGCGSDTTSTTLNKGQGAIAAKLVWDGEGKATAKTAFSAPVGVSTVRIVVTGPAMTTIQQEFTAASGSGTINKVPSGTGLTVTVSGLDASGVVTYKGLVSNVTVKTGQTTDVGTINMQSFLTSITVTPTNSSLTIGGTQQFTATGAYSDGSTKDLNSSVTWSSSNTAVASIAASGIVNVLAKGTSTITATLGVITGTTTLTTTLRTATIIAGTSATGVNDYGSADGTGSSAQFYSPFGITTDGINLYVADTGNSLIRKVVISTGVVTTIANYQAHGITIGGTILYVTNTSKNTISKIDITSGSVSILAGSEGIMGENDGVGSSARFNRPEGITIVGTNLYVVDSGNNLIRKIDIATETVTTIAGTQGSYTLFADGSGISARFNDPQGITTDGTNLYITDASNAAIRKMVISTSQVSTIITAGTWNSYSTHSLGGGIATDGINLYVTDSFYNEVFQTSISSGYSPTIVKIADVPRGITIVGTTLYTSNSRNTIIKIQ